jgi:hypothetical protein
MLYSFLKFKRNYKQKINPTFEIFFKSRMNFVYMIITSLKMQNKRPFKLDKFKLL